MTFDFLCGSRATAAVISRSAEISLGREGAQEYERKEAIDTDPVLAARVRRIGQRLIAAGEPTEYPFEFHAVETNGINAFALPGGFIYIYRGLAQLVPNDDALAFILAHEISHVTQRHGVKQIEKSIAIYAALNAVLRRSMASSVLQLVLDMHYSRHDELESDRLGLERMAKAGFDPTQGAEAMAVVARAAKSGRSIPPFLRSHPLPDSRIAALRRQAQALRAAPRPVRTVSAALPLPEPPRIAAPPAPIQRSDLFPLAVGTRWTYRLSGSPERRTFTTTVLEEQPDHPGVFRIRTEVDNALAVTRLVTVTATGICASPYRTEGARSLSHPTPTSTWEVEVALPASPPLEDAAWETVRVPAGEFRALRAGQRSAGGEPEATVWLVPGVGVVRREWKRTGLVEELESIQQPALENDEGESAKSGQP